MKIGFVGTGHLASAMVTALCYAGTEGQEIIVSPRNRTIATGLAAQFDAVSVAPDNQSVVRESDVVMVAVRPDDAEHVLAPLTFRSSQLVISLMALVPTARVQALVDPAPAVRALCLPTVAQHQGSIVLYPECQRAKELLEPLSDLLVLEDEHALEMLWTVTGMMATQLQFLSSIAEWLTARGVPKPMAERYTRGTFAAVNHQAAGSRDDLSQMVLNAQTPGGLNEQALSELRESGFFAHLSAVLDNLAVRVLDELND